MKTVTSVYIGAKLKKLFLIILFFWPHIAWSQDVPAYHSDHYTASLVSISLTEFTPQNIRSNDMSTAQFILEYQVEISPSIGKDFDISGTLIRDINREIAEDGFKQLEIRGLEYPELTLYDLVNEKDIPKELGKVEFYRLAKLAEINLSTEDNHITKELERNLFVSTYHIKVVGEFRLKASQIPIPTAFFGKDYSIYIEDGKALKRSPHQILKAKSLSNNNLFYIFSFVLFTLLCALNFLIWRAVRFRKIEERKKAHLDLMRSQAADQSKEFSNSLEDPLPHPEVPQNLRENIIRNKCVLVAGSGVSQEAKYYSDIQIIQELAAEFHQSLPSYTLALIDKLSAPKHSGGTSSVSEVSFAMEAILSKIPRSDIIESLNRIYSNSNPSEKFHKSLMRLPWTGVLSMTWDDMFDNILPIAGVDLRKDTDAAKPLENAWRKLFLLDNDAIRRSMRNNDRFYIKLLGNFARPSSMSLNFEEFRSNIGQASEFQRQMNLLLQTQSFFFLGVGIDTIKEFLQSLGSSVKPENTRHYALVPENSANAIFRDTLGEHGVELIEYPPFLSPSGIQEFVSKLNSEISRKDMQPRQSEAKKAINNVIASSQITKLSLRNIGPFSSIDLDFNKDPAETTEKNPRAPWTVLMGPNGSGKSVIMRAVGIALCGNEDWVKERAGSILKNGKQSGTIDLEMGGKKLHVDLRRENDRVEVDPTHTSFVEVGQTLVLGFPSMRGGPSSDPTSHKSLESPSAQPIDLKPLITNDIDDRMINFKQWVVNHLFASHNEEASKAAKSKAKKIIVLLNNIVNEIVPGEYDGFAPLGDKPNLRLQRRIAQDPTSKSAATYEYVDFSSISQGMSSIFNWVGVLIQRLYDFYDFAEEPQNGHAIVLVDEVDVHLHPDWQRRLVSMIRDQFPNVQVIASSHSALMAGALYSKEIRIIRPDQIDGGFIVEMPSIEVYGRSASFILKSEVIDLPTERAPKIEKDIKRYKQIQKLPQKGDIAVEMAQLEDRLKEVKWAGIASEELEKNWSKPSQQSLAELQRLLKK